MLALGMRVRTFGEPNLFNAPNGRENVCGVSDAAQRHSPHSRPLAATFGRRRHPQFSPMES
jgi:hypothetical protein